jgi:hypothetical protein
MKFKPILISQGIFLLSSIMNAEIIEFDCGERLEVVYNENSEVPTFQWLSKIVNDGTGLRLVGDWTDQINSIQRNKHLQKRMYPLAAGVCAGVATAIYAVMQHEVERPNFIPIQEHTSKIIEKDISPMHLNDRPNTDAFSMIDNDYSQIELMCAAILNKDGKHWTLIVKGVTECSGNGYETYQRFYVWKENTKGLTQPIVGHIYEGKNPPHSIYVKSGDSIPSGYKKVYTFQTEDLKETFFEDPPLSVWSDKNKEGMFLSNNGKSPIHNYIASTKIGTYYRENMINPLFIIDETFPFHWGSQTKENGQRHTRMISKRRESIVQATGQLQYILFRFTALWGDINILQGNNNVYSYVGGRQNTQSEKMRMFCSRNPKFPDIQSLRIERQSILPRDPEYPDVRFANVQIQYGPQTYAMVIIPMDLYIPPNRIRHAFIESIRTASPVRMEPVGRTPQERRDAISRARVRMRNVPPPERGDPDREQGLITWNLAPAVIGMIAVGHASGSSSNRSAS